MLAQVQENLVDIPIKEVAAFKWTPDRGSRLKQLRTDFNGYSMSRSKLASLTKGAVSLANLRKIEEGEAQSVPLSTLEVIANALGYTPIGLWHRVTDSSPQ